LFPDIAWLDDTRLVIESYCHEIIDGWRSVFHGRGTVLVCVTDLVLHVNRVAEAAASAKTLASPSTECSSIIYGGEF